MVRGQLLGYEADITETGDLAYRAVLSSDSIKTLNERPLDALIKEAAITSWLGPEKHAVLYPVRGQREWNLVLL